MEVETLRELFKHPGWQVYLDEVNGQMLVMFRQMFALDTSKAESYTKFIELKASIDALRNVTYMYERELAAEKVAEVDTSYTKRFMDLLKSILRS